MSPTLIIILLITGWLTVAAAMLWGVLRISRHHHPQPLPEPQQKTARPTATAANAH